MPANNPSQADITIDLNSSTDVDLQAELRRLTEVLAQRREQAAQSPSSLTGSMANVGSSLLGGPLARVVGSMATLYQTLKEMQDRSEAIKVAAAEADRARYSSMIIERELQERKLKDAVEKARAERNDAERQRILEAHNVRSGRTRTMDDYNAAKDRHENSVQGLANARTAYKSLKNSPPPLPGSGGAAGGAGGMAGGLARVAGAAGAVVTTFQSIYAAGKAAYQALDKSAEELSKYNGQLAAARAEQNMQITFAKMRRAAVQGESLTEFTKQQTRILVSQESLDAKWELQAAKVLNPVMERIADVMELVDIITDVTQEIGLTAENFIKTFVPMYDVILGISDAGVAGWTAVLEWFNIDIAARKEKKAQEAKDAASSFFNALMKMPVKEEQGRGEKPPDPLRGVIF